MINQRLFIHKFCNNSKMLLSSSWAIFVRALVFSFSPSANFSSLKYLCFSFLLVFEFKNNDIIIKIEKFQLCFIIYFDTTNHSHLLFLFNQKLQCSDFGNLNKRSSMTKTFRRNTDWAFCYCRDLKTSWLEHFVKFNKRWVWNKNVLGEKLFMFGDEIFNR